MSNRFLNQSECINKIRGIKSLEEIIRFYGVHYPDKMAVTFDDQGFTYKELYRKSTKFANYLISKGIIKDSRVAVMIKNSTLVFETLFGARMASATYIPINWRLSPEEVAYIVKDSEAQVLVIGEEFDNCISAILELDNPPRLLVSGSGDSINDDYSALVSNYSHDDPGYSSKPPDVALQLYTSGTTGRPKGVMLTNSNIFAYFRASQKAHPLPPFGVHLISLPLFHVGGINWSLQGLVRGGHCVGLSNFDAEGMLALIGKYKVTDSIMVPAVIQMMVNAADPDRDDYSSLKVIVYGGSLLTAELAIRTVDIFDCSIYGMYGATEVSFGLTLLFIDRDLISNDPQLLKSVGVPLPGTTLRIVDPETLEDVREGVEGEIWIHSAQVSPGYWKQLEATAASFTSDGWFRSGDIGKIIDGNLYITDRLKDMIKTGGENVYPAEVERILCAHEAVEECAVIGIPDKKWDESVKAYVVLVQSSQVTPEALINYTRDHLAHFKCPTRIEFLDVIPKTASGKTMKDELRKRSKST